jgi:lipoate-protein ligase A
MLCINSSSHDTYFNIASEEYLLKRFTDDIFLLYRNLPSVIVGKHQNTLAEIDMKFVTKNGIRVVRRLSGGGAVYHDMGNLNFTFIRNGSEGKLVDFRGFTQPIVSALATIGIQAKFEGHNSLTVNGKKVSGNAEHVFKNRVMHHGTLLFSTNLVHLSRILYVDENRYNDKAVKSVRANVTNISEHLAKSMTIENFTKNIWEFVIKSNANANEYVLSEDDHTQIQKLCKEKYTNWEWNFGYSPKYSLKRDIKSLSGNLSISLKIDKGKITYVEITDSNLPENIEISIKKSLIGCDHEANNLWQALQKSTLDTELKKTILEGIV